MSTADRWGEVADDLSQTSVCSDERLALGTAVRGILSAISAKRNQATTGRAAKKK